MNRIAWRTSKNFLLHTSFKKAKSDSVKQVILGVIFLYIKKDRNEPCEMRNHSSPMIKKCLLKCQRKICFKNQSIILSLCVSHTHTHTHTHTRVRTHPIAGPFGAWVITWVSACYAIQVTAAWGCSNAHTQLHTFTWLWHRWKCSTCTIRVSSSLSSDLPYTQSLLLLFLFPDTCTNTSLSGDACLREQKK